MARLAWQLCGFPAQVARPAVCSASLASHLDVTAALGMATLQLRYCNLHLGLPCSLPCSSAFFLRGRVCYMNGGPSGELGAVIILADASSPGSTL